LEIYFAGVPAGGSMRGAFTNRVRVVHYHCMPRSYLIGKPIWRVWFMSWGE